MNLLWFDEQVFLQNIWRKLAVLVVIVLVVTGVAFGLAGIVNGFRLTTLSELFATQVGAVDLIPEATAKFWGRFLFHLLCVLAFGGLLVSVLCSAVQLHEDRVRAGLVRYRGLSGHYVVMGWSALTPELVERLLTGELNDDDWLSPDAKSPNRKGRKPRILLCTVSQVEEVRRELEDRLDEKDFRRVVFYYCGLDFDNPDTQQRNGAQRGRPRRIERILDELGVASARKVFLLADRSDPWGRDVKILAFARTIASLFQTEGGGLGNRRKAAGLSPVLPVFAELDARGSQDVVPKFPSSPVGKASSDNFRGTIYFRPFSMHELWATRLFSLDLPRGIRPLLYRPVGPGDRVHLVVVGFTRMGAALTVQALRSCHIPARNPKGPGTFVPVRITVVDKLPQKNVFQARYPHLEQIQDVSLDFHVADIADPKVRELIRESAVDPRCLLTVAVCLEDSDTSLAIALNLPEEVYQWGKSPKKDFPHRLAWKQDGNNVWVRQDFASGFADALGSDDTRFAWVGTFGAASDVLTPRSFIETGAMIRSRMYEKAEEAKKAGEGPIDPQALGGKEPVTAKWLLDQFLSKWLLDKFLPEAFGFFLSLDWTKRWANVHAGDSVAILLSSLGYRADPDGCEDFRERLRNNVAKFPVDWREFEEKLAAAHGFAEDSFAEAEHRRWMADRTLAGFRQTRDGETRDDEFLIHHSFRPFSELVGKLDTKNNDRNNILAIPICLALEGYRIVDATTERPQSPTAERRKCHAT